MIEEHWIPENDRPSTADIDLGLVPRRDRPTKHLSLPSILVLIAAGFGAAGLAVIFLENLREASASTIGPVNHVYRNLTAGKTSGSAVRLTDDGERLTFHLEVIHSHAVAIKCSIECGVGEFCCEYEDNVVCEAIPTGSKFCEGVED